jgi:hypothetical protein
MVIRAANGTSVVIDFREEAPAYSFKDMYARNPNGSKLGGTAVAVPGELRGFEMAHKMYVLQDNSAPAMACQSMPYQFGVGFNIFLSTKFLCASGLVSCLGKSWSLLPSSWHRKVLL